MKRTLVATNYNSSDEESETSVVPPVQKKRKQLPPVSLDLTISVPIDDPSKHQGRVRTRPYVDGQFTAHVYVPIPFGRGSQKLHSTITRLVGRLQAVVPEMHSLAVGTDSKSGNSGSFHISLSRPIYLRAHQRDGLQRAVQSATQGRNQFSLSFARISSFTNDERTRIFISVEIGAGHSELKQITDALTPFIKGLHQEPYYAVPRFHFSVAWALLDEEGPSSASAAQEEPDENEEKDTPSFPSITGIPVTLIEDLNKEFGEEIRRSGTLVAETIQLKIGKTVSAFKLR